jgi:lipopolysaccharide transport system permease protein
MLLLPALLLVQMMLAFGTGLIVAALTTRWKDLNFLITFAVQMLMYASPVIFPLSRLVPGSKTYKLIAANPMTPIIEGFRAALLGTPAQWGSLWYSFLVASLMLLLGLALFQRAQRSYADVV